MLRKLCDEGENQELKINMSKTKMMVANDIHVNNTQIEHVESYIYLEYSYSTRDKNQDKEIQRRIIGTRLKRQVYNSCVLPAMTYGAETWALTTQAKNKLVAAQTKMERIILNITCRTGKRYENRQRSQTWVNKSETGSGHEQGTSVGYEITVYHHLETLRKETI